MPPSPKDRVARDERPHLAARVIRAAVKRGTDPGAWPRTAAWREEYQLARLTMRPAFSGGTAVVRGFHVEYTHPQSLAAQVRAIFQEEHYRFESAREAPFIVDCGANIGLATLYWKSLYPAAEILAFEPDPLIAAILRRNIGTAGVSRVEIREAAIWISAGLQNFHQQGAGAGRLGEGQTLVETVRLLDVLKDKRVDVLKLDIEGAEVDVLEDCSTSLAAVERIFVEYHSFVGEPQRLNVLWEVLQQAGYRLFVATEFCPSSPFVAQENNGGMDLQLNIYGTRQA